MCQINDSFVDRSFYKNKALSYHQCTVTSARCSSNRGYRAAILELYNDWSRKTEGKDLDFR
jgi:hypothetical protein